MSSTDRALKRQVRERMAATGENYTTALTRIRRSALRELRPLPWGTLPDGRAAEWNVAKFAHCMVAGRSGSGKSASLLELLRSAVVAGWDTVVIDHEQDLGRLDAGHAPLDQAGIVAPGARSAQIALEHAVEQMQSRNKIIDGHHASSFRELPPDVEMRPLLVMVDGIDSLFVADATDSAPGVAALLERIAREGRRPAVHLVVSMRRPSIRLIETSPGLWQNFDYRVLLGRPTFEDRMALLRRPHDTPDPGDRFGAALVEDGDEHRVVQFGTPTAQPNASR